MIFKKLVFYINPLNWFKKSSTDVNLNFMHGINKISLILFFVALIVMLVRWMG
jgi:hypothetical protein